MPKQDNSQNPFYNEQADLRYPTPRKEEETQTEEALDVLSNPSKTNPEVRVRINQDASLPDKEYCFDEENTGSEEYHDADDGVNTLDI